MVATAAQRILGIFPNHNASPCLSPYVPVISQDKFKIAVADAFGLGAVVLAALTGGVAQLFNSNRPFGQEASGYSRYVGAADANHDRRFLNGRCLPIFASPGSKILSEGQRLRQCPRAVCAEPGLLDANGRRKYGLQLFESAWRFQHGGDFKLVLRQPPGCRSLRSRVWRAARRHDGREHP